MSAHVSGMAGSAQISLNDNLMNRGSPEEVEAVLGHEMGHYVLNHVYKGVLAMGVVLVIGFAFMSWAFGRVTLKFGERWGFRDAGDVAGMPLLIALFSVYVFVLTPVFNTITRTMEAEADAFGLNAARQPDGAAQAALHLAEYRKMQPGALEEVIFFDHPERLESHSSGDGLEGRESIRQRILLPTTRCTILPVSTGSTPSADVRGLCGPTTRLPRKGGSPRSANSRSIAP